jgi:hypothetical protein
MPSMRWLAKSKFKHFFQGVAVFRTMLFLTVVGPTAQAAEASKATPLVIILNGAGDLKVARMLGKVPKS